MVESIFNHLRAPLELVETNSIYHLLYLLFAHAAICFLFCTLYRFLHILLNVSFIGSSNGGKSLAIVRTIHWIVLTLIVAISIADFALWVIISFAFLVIEGNYQPVEITRYVILWLASWEITGWAAVLAIKARRAQSILIVRVFPILTEFH